MTSDGGVYTCQVSLSSENMFIALQQPVTNVMHTVIVTSKHVNVCECVCVVLAAREAIRATVGNKTGTTDE